MEKCDKCGMWVNPIDSNCIKCKCSYGKRREDKEKDFRAFRRQVLLALITGDYYRTMEIDRIWKDADSIARAEPKGE